ncbi:MAG TPA: electron transport complex subunit RsxG [Burkholderiales bacterium]|nr:electron transport complex subunit RsxG [Burkholderiales bacterium]
MKRGILQTSLTTSLIMLGFVVLTTLLLALTYGRTHDLITRSEEEEKLSLINQVLPPGISDNDLLHDTIEIAPNELLGNRTPVTAYRARFKGKPVAVVLEATAPDGYGGRIVLLVAILANGEISGVRVISQNETPGLGDYIEVAKSSWIKGFDHVSLASMPSEAWHVKKDGGKFDYMTGATITPRAVVKAVHKALEYFASNRAKLFAQRSSK